MKILSNVTRPLTLDQSYDTAYANIFPVLLNAVATIGPVFRGNATRVVSKLFSQRNDHLLFSLVLLSLSQKLIVPSAPAVLNVP